MSYFLPTILRKQFYSNMLAWELEMSKLFRFKINSDMTDKICGRFLITSFHDILVFIRTRNKIAFPLCLNHGL